MTTPKAYARHNIDAQLTACGGVARLRQAILTRAFVGKLINPKKENTAKLMMVDGKKGEQ